MTILNKLRSDVGDHTLHAFMYFCSPDINLGGEDAMTRRHDTIMEFADANDIHVTEEFIVTQKPHEMAKFLEVLESYEDGDFDLLLTYSVENLAVEYREWPFFMAQLQRHSIPVLSVLEPFGEDDPCIRSGQNMLQGYHDFLLRMDSTRKAMENGASIKDNLPEHPTVHANENSHKQKSA